MVKLHCPPAVDAQRDAEDAFARLRTRLVAAGVPPTSTSIGFDRWATMARRTAPRELDAFVDACKAVMLSHAG